jgi:Tol biopolymer transport system component
MSPEQVRGEEVDHRSDLFSFGVILYEMVGGKRAFSGVSSVEIMHAILTEEPPELSPSVASALVRIVRRCLEKDPARRFQSAADLAFALESDPASQPPPALARKRPSWLTWGVAAAICLAATITAYLWGIYSRPVGIVAGTTLRRLTTDSGLTTDAAISQDGKLVAYASDRANSSNLDIWVQQIEGGATVRLTDDPSDNYDPAISPDGSQVAFHSERTGGGIYVVPTLGGAARLLIPKGRRPRFSPDGQSLMYSVGDGDDYAPVDLFIQRLSGGTPTQIGAGCHPLPLSAVWSPDGSRILFDGRCPEDGGKESAWVSTADGRRTGRLPLQEPIIDQWLPSPSRLLVPFDYFRVLGASDEASITALPVATDGTKVTGPSERVTFGTGTERHVSAARGLMTLSAVNRDDHIWGVPIDASGHATDGPRQLTSGSAGESLGYLSRDGQKLIFFSHRADHHQLYLRDLKTRKEQEIPSEGVFVWTTALSPDGSRLMFTSDTYRRSDPAGFLYELPIAGGFPRKILGEGTAFYALWDWSPDGSTILFFSYPGSEVAPTGIVQELDVESNSRTIFLQDPSYQVWQAHFSPDGRWVVFNGTKDLRSELFVAPFRKGFVPRSEWIPIADTGLDDKPHFSADGKLIFFSSDRDGYRCIWAQAVASDMHPAGAPFAVYHAHERRRSLRNRRRGKAASASFEIAVGPEMLLFNQEERTGNIWLLEPAKKDAH